MVLQEVVKVDSRTIDDFCRVTFDDNAVHNSNTMNEKGFHAIVPGMYALSRTLSLAERSGGISAEAPFVLDVQFGAPLREGEEILFEVRDHPDISGAKVLSSRGEKGEALATKECGSYVKSSSHEGVHYPFKLPSGVTLPDETYSDFMKLVGREDSKFMRVLYALACSSFPLLNCLKQPSEDAEIVVHQKMKEGHMPVYTSLLVRTEQTAGLDGLMKLSYLPHVSFDGKRTISTNVDAFSEGKLVFSAYAKLALIPDKLIYRNVATRMLQEQRT